MKTKEEWQVYLRNTSKYGHINHNVLYDLIKEVKETILTDKELDKLVATRELMREFLTKQDKVNGFKDEDLDQFSSSCDVVAVKENNKQYFLLNEFQARLAQIWL